MPLSCQITTEMEIFPQSCACQSATKNFLIVAFENIINSSFPCENDNELDVFLETEDYQALGFCQPPVMDQYYSIALRLPGANTENRKNCNSSHPYFWRTKINPKLDCVDGSPLKLPRNFDDDQLCNLASVLPGSLDQIYNATWTRCNSVQYSICQLEKNSSVSSFCKNISTTSTATIATTTTTITALSNNSTAIIIGSVVGAFVILLLVLLLRFFQKRHKTKRNASNKENHEEVQ